MHYDVARAYTARLGELGRANALSGPGQWSGIAACATGIRKARNDRYLTAPSLSLSDLATLSLDHDKYPEESKFTPGKCHVGARRRKTRHGLARKRRAMRPRSTLRRNHTTEDRRRNAANTIHEALKETHSRSVACVARIREIRARADWRANTHKILPRWQPPNDVSTRTYGPGRQICEVGKRRYVRLAVDPVEIAQAEAKSIQEMKTRRRDAEVIIRRIHFVSPVRPNFRRGDLTLFMTILYPLRRGWCWARN